MKPPPDHDELRLHPVDGPSIAPLTLKAPARVTIGRGMECTFELHDAAVSRLHAAISFEDGTWSLVDTDSRHGTYLNSIRVESAEPVQLHAGDVVAIGPWRFVVEMKEDEAPPAEPLPPATAGSADTSATRGTIFVRLGDASTSVREVSWQEFSDRYRPAIVRFAERAGAKPAEADDIAQDVMLGFFRVSNDFEYDAKKGRFRGYLKRATLNALRARYRRARPAAGLDGDLVADEDGASAMWEREWTNVALQRALEHARPEFENRTWRAFELYGRRGVPAEQVAEDLGMSKESVRHAKSRVAKVVREAFLRARSEQS